MMSETNIPMPPLELRRLVGPTDPEDFDNPTGTPICAEFDLPLHVYDTVFDFGCGCGRQARQLLLQTPRPRRYIGIDPNKGMVDWCSENLTPVDNNFQFFHHDVYSPGYAPGNTLRLAEPFPADNESMSLFIGHSVFTHLCRPQTEYYLSELRRVLKPGGIAFTTWFFFDNSSFPFLQEGPFCLYTSEADFSQAVIYDRTWFIDAVRERGLCVTRTDPPGVAGHQWMVLLTPRTAGMDDRFPQGDEAAEWLCGATSKPAGKPVWPAEYIEKTRGEKRDTAPPAKAAAGPPQPPRLFGRLALLEKLMQSK
jgi:SAM-dependent methyltransferase